MTIEEEFYKTFDIKPVTLKDFNYNTFDYNFKTICINEVRYLKITDRILLELICIYTKFFDIGDNVFKDTKDLKNFILQGLMLDVSNSLKNRVKSLFEEGEEDDQ